MVTGNFDYSSTCAADQYERLQEILYFNRSQGPYQEAIEELVSDFGSPVIVEEQGRLAVKLGGTENLCLFAATEEEVVGVALFCRPRYDTFEVLHIAADESYVGGGEQAHRALAQRMILRLKDIASRIRGIERMTIRYHRDRSISLHRESVPQT